MKSCFNIFCNIYVNVFCFNVAMKLSISMEHNFAFSSYFWIFVFFFFFFFFFNYLLLTNFSKKILLHDSLVMKPNNSFFLQLLHASDVFFVLFMVFWNIALFIHLTRFFLNHFLFCFFFLSSVLISVCGSSQAFWSNSIILCAFLNTNLWFNACFQFLICITYSSFHSFR